jgi:hypothetical protein
MGCGTIGLYPKFVPDQKIIFLNFGSVAKYSGFFDLYNISAILPL